MGILWGMHEKDSIKGLNDVNDYNYVSCSKHQPSLLHTFNSYDDNSRIFDLIDDMISDYELSINLEDNASNKVTIQCYSYESASFDLIDNMISDDELSINFKSIEINNTTIRPPSHNISTRFSTAINNAICNRNRLQSPLKPDEFMQAKTTPASTVISGISKLPSCSQNIYDMRIKLR